MNHIKTSKGVINYIQRLPRRSFKPMDTDMALNNLSVIKDKLDRTGILWGPIFGTLIGIIRNDNFLPWAKEISLFFLKEDEERFKDTLWSLFNEGFSLVRYERRGIYEIERNGISIDFYVLRKISSNIRHSGGEDFILEKYIQNQTPWNFRGLTFNVPSDVDEMLTMLYGDWTQPKRKDDRKTLFDLLQIFIKDHLPDTLYYPLILRYHKKHFEHFRELCSKTNNIISEDVQLSYSKPRKGRKILTIGVYDLLHKGHIELFRRAKALGDHLTVAVQDGGMITKFKPQAKVLNSTEERLFIVSSIRYVDEAIVYTSADDIVKKTDFDILVCGPDQTNSAFQEAFRWCEEHGKEVTILSRTSGVSSSKLKEKIAIKIKKIC